MAQELAAAGVRVQAVVPGSDSRPASRRTAHYQRRPGLFRSYTVTEHRVRDEDLTSLLSHLAVAATAYQPSEGDLPPPDGSTGERAVDVLICGHGKRDQCCGTWGTRLVASLADLDDSSIGKGGTATLWRTSHTGGHRFAPTGLLLPEGTAWAYLDEETLPAIVDRTLDVDVAATLYRGCTGLDDPAVQVCDREALRRLGWSWLDHHRSGHVLTRDDDLTTVRLDYQTPSGKTGAFEATVEVARRLPVPDCRRPLDQARKSAAELRAVSFQPV